MVVVGSENFFFVNVHLLKHNFFTFFTIIDRKMLTTDSSVRVFQLILMSWRNSQTPICDEKKEETVESRVISSVRLIVYINQAFLSAVMLSVQLNQMC